MKAAEVVADEADEEFKVAAEQANQPPDDQSKQEPQIKEDIEIISYSNNLDQNRPKYGN